MSTTDKTRTEDPREVLMRFVTQMGARSMDALEVIAYIDKHYPPPAPPKPEPVWRESKEGYRVAIIDGRIKVLVGSSVQEHFLLTVPCLLQLAADYYRQQGVTVPHEAVEAAAKAWRDADVGADVVKVMVGVAAPHILAANGHAKPKAVDWVVWDVRDRRVVYCPRDHADALSWVRAFGNDATSILALVEPSEVQP